MAISINEPVVNLTGRYPIGKAAEILGMSRGTLRKYSDLGLIKTGHRRTGKQERFFLGSDLLHFWRTQA